MSIGCAKSIKKKKVPILRMLEFIIGSEIMCDMVKSHRNVLAKPINTSAVKSNKCVSPRGNKKYELYSH